MIGTGCLGQDSSWGYSIRELHVCCPKLREIPLEPQLDHPGWPVEVSLKGLTIGHLIQKMVEVGNEERPRGHIVEGMQCLHQ